MNFGMSGSYDLILNEGTDRERIIEKDNAILNNFLDWLKVSSLGGNSFNNLGKQIRIGASDTPVDFAQVALVDPLYSKTVNSSAYTPVTSDGTNWTCSVTFISDYTLGEFVGTIKEVGFGINNNTSKFGIIYSRAVLNSPLEVTAEDQLTIKYTLTLTCNDQDVVSNITLNGTNYSVKARRTSNSGPRPFASFMEQSYDTNTYLNGSTLGTKGLPPSGGTIFSKSATGVDGSVAGQKIIRLVLESNESNHASGINVIDWLSIYKFEFTPAIAKTSNTKLTLDFSYTFGRG